MKKMIAVALAGCLLLSCLSGCSGNTAESNSIVSSAMSSSTVLQDTPTPEPTATPTPGPKVNEIEYEGLKFSVPANWTKQDGGTVLNYVTSYDAASLLSVSVSENNSDFELEVTSDLYKSAFISGIATVDGYESISTSDITVNDHSGFEHRFKADIISGPTDVVMIVFGTADQKTATFTFGIDSSADEDTKKAFEEDMNSILKSVDTSAITPVASETPPETEVESKATPTQTPVPTPAIDWYSAGMYKVGENLPAGIYYFKSLKRGYYAVSSDASGDLGSIISNDNVDTFSFLQVEDGQYLEVSRGQIAPADQIEAIGPTNGKYGPGTYRVGVDIPSGEYNLIVEDENTMGYYAVLSGLSGSITDIVSNDNFEGNAYVSISEGQYLKISRAYIVEE